MLGLWLVEDDDGAKYATQCSLVDEKELAHKLHGSLWAEFLTDVWQKWNLWSRFTSAVLQEWKDVRIFMESMCPSSHTHWNKTQSHACEMFFFANFLKTVTNSSEIICCNAALSAVAAAPDGWQRCLEMIRLPRAWDDISDSACFWKCTGQAKNQILRFSLLESRHFKEGFLIWVGA